MGLQIRFFGHLQVSEGPEALTHRLPARSQRLLAFLLIRRRAPMAREAAAFTLWPDNPETESLGALRRSLSELRAALPAADGREWVIAAHGELQWNPDAAYWLDSEEFERGLRQSTPAALHNAINLYTGDLLPELGDEWAVVERERLRQCQLDALGQLAAHHRALGEYETAIDLARRWLAIDPLAEAAHRDLMALHYLNGDRASALAAYEQLRASLQTELGVEPMTETRAVAETINKGRPLPAPAPRRPRAKSEKKDTPKPIGRETEMAALAALWENAAVGRGRCVIVSGEAGVGKSHLINNLADYAVTRGGLTLTGHCYEFERALPYQAIVEMLRAAAGVLALADLPSAHRASLAVLAPDVLGAAGAPPLGADAENRAQLFESVLQAFLSLANSQPLLLIIEDAHWASESTLDWLTYAAPHVAGSRALVVITYRTGEIGSGHALARLQRRLIREGAAVAVTLAPLSQETNRALVGRMSGLEDEQSSVVADQLFAETAGNPLFLQEVVRRLIESDQIVVANGRWSGPFVEAAPGARVPLPESLRETIGARVARLGEPSESFIRAAAVAGRVFEYETVRRAGQWAEEAALEALEDLLARNLIRRSGDEGAFAFEHHLVREAIYADLAAPRRSAWHRRIASAIEALRPDDESRLGDLAYHFLHGQEWEKAAGYVACAAEQAELRYADDEALNYHRQALEALSHVPASTGVLERRFDTLAKMERAADRRGDFALERQLLEQMLSLATELEDDVRLAHTHCYRGQNLRQTGYYREALLALDEAHRQAAKALEAGNIKATPILAMSLVLSSMAHSGLSEQAEARACSERAIRAYDELPFPPGFPTRRWRLVAARPLIVVHVRRGRFQQAVDWGEEILDGFRNTPGVPRYEAGLTMTDLAHAYFQLGAFERARRLLHESQVILGTTGIRAILANIDMSLADIALAECQTAITPTMLEEARELIEQATTKFDFLEARLQENLERQIAVRRWRLELLGGNLEAARQHLAAITNAPIWAAEFYVAAGQTDAALEASAQAIEPLEAPGREPHPFDVRCRYWRYRALEAAGQREAAGEQLRRAFDELMLHAGGIRDPELRSGFLDNVTEHRGIREAWERGL